MRSGRNLRESWLKPAILALASALVLALAGFGFGWFLSGRQLAQTGAHPATVSVTTQPKATLPKTDVPGEDLSDLPRYPGSVRVGYRRKTVGGRLVLTKVTYEAAARLDEVKDFYRGVFRSGDWTVADLDFSSGKWIFLVVRRDEQAYVGIERRGERLVRITVRLNEPRHPRRSEQGTTTPSPAPNGGSAGQSAPASSYSAPPSYYPAPPGDNEDDYDDYDD